MAMSNSFWRGVCWTSAAVAGLLALSVSTAGAQNCGLKLLASYPMREDPIGRLVIPLTVEGSQRNMIVDTGGFVSLMSTDAVDAAKLPKFAMSGTVYSTRGRITTYTKANVAIGALHGDAMQFLVADAFPGWKQQSIAGTLGPNILTRFDVDFDFGGKKLNILLQDHCPGQVVYWSKAYAVLSFPLDDNGHIELPVTLDGKEMKALIDTGATGSVLNASTARDTFGLTASGSQSASGDAYVATLHTLTIGSIAVQNPRFYVAPDKIGRDMQSDEAMSGYIGVKQKPSMIIGNDILRQLHFYIAYAERKIYVTAADAH